MDPEGLVGRTLVGRFRIDRILGRGGMATVYAAFDQQRGVPVALKVLKRELTRDSMVLRRFEREAKAASHLQHPNVVEVLDWGVEGDEAFISMELAQGTDLLKALAKQRPMKQVRAVIVLSQVCSALSAAHSKGIVHRDLKPENILLVPDPTEPGGERAKVLDFGIAKVLDVSKTSSNPDEPPSYVTKTALTRVGTIVGTPAYMSPEQCRGGEIDGRSDIYACGVLLYQLVTGDLPFTGETPLHTAMRHIHAQPRAPSESRRDLAPALERVITKALAKWPGERQQSAQQLREELLATLPLLPDRGDVVLPEGFGVPHAPATSSPAAGAPTPPPKPAGSVRPASPDAGGARPAPREEPHAPPAAPAPAPARAAPAARNPSVVPSAPPPAPGADAERAPEEHPSGDVDVTHPTRQLVGGPLGGTPLRAVRLTRGAAEAAPVSREVSQNPPSLAPLTTQPDAPLGGPARAREEPARHEDEDDPRTLMRPDLDGATSEDPPFTHDPVKTPRTSPREPQGPGAAPLIVEGKVTTDPIEQIKPIRTGHAPTLQAAPSPAAAAARKLPRTEQLSQDQLGAPLPPMPPIARPPHPASKPPPHDEHSMGAQAFSADAPGGLIARTRAGTDRPALRPAKAKPTQTGLTPTMQKHPTGNPPPAQSTGTTAPIAHAGGGQPVGMSLQGIAAHLPPPPPPPPTANTGSGTFEDPTLRRSAPQPPQRSPTAPIPVAAPHGSFALSQSHLGQSAVVQSAAGQGASAQGAQAQRIVHGPPPQPVRSPMVGSPPQPPMSGPPNRSSQPPVAPGDEDEPPTNVREIAGPGSNSGKTLVMEEPAQGNSPPQQHRRGHDEGRPLHASPASPSNPGAVTGAPRHDPAQQAQQAHQYVDQNAAYASQESDAFRGLKATARIGQDESERATNPLQMSGLGGMAPDKFANTGENLQGVKATVRMNPQETMTAVNNADPNSPRQAPRPAANVQPPSNRAAPSPQSAQPPPSPQAGSAQRIPDLSFQQTGYRLAPGSWTEPTVVKRKPPVDGREGLVSSLQGLSGTTGLLIGIGLGLGIAAGLLIAFLLARG